MVTPSKKIISLSILCLAIIFSVAIYKTSDKTDTREDFILATITPDISFKIDTLAQNTDTDGDGLKDWEEALWSTDPENTDTDGDKTSDGEEVLANRDPNKKAPNDGLAEVKIAQKSVVPNIYESFTKNSLTDSVSQDLFSYYLQTKQNNGVLSGEELNNIAEQISSETTGQSLFTDKYTIEAVGVFSDSDINAILKYSNDFGRVYIDFSNSIQNSPNDLKVMATYFANFSKQISLMKAPNSLRGTHLEIMNNFYNSSIALLILADFEKDPVKASLATKVFRGLDDRRPQLFTTVASYILRSGIIFDNQDIEDLWQNI
jgi:hypothetical protein